MSDEKKIIRVNKDNSADKLSYYLLNNAEETVEMQCLGPEANTKATLAVARANSIAKGHGIGKRAVVSPGWKHFTTEDGYQRAVHVVRVDWIDPNNLPWTEPWQKGEPYVYPPKKPTGIKKPLPFEPFQPFKPWEKTEEDDEQPTKNKPAPQKKRTPKKTQPAPVPVAPPQEEPEEIKEVEDDTPLTPEEIEEIAKDFEWED